MNEQMKLLFEMLSEPLDRIQPEKITMQIRAIRDSFDEKTHTFVNANILEDQINALWQNGHLNSELLVFLCTNIIYDTQAVISLRRHVATFARKNNPHVYKKC